LTGSNQSIPKARINKPFYNLLLKARMKVTIVQPAMPSYRWGLFERLAQRFGSDFTVYASRQEELGILSDSTRRETWLQELEPIRPLFFGLDWQHGAFGIPVRRGDVLVVCGAPRTLSTLALLIKCKIQGVHTIWWGHYWSSTSKPWRAAFRFALMGLPDNLLFYTDQEVAEYKQARGGKIAKPVFGLNNGVETDRIAKLRAPYHAEERLRDLFFISRITPKSELKLLLNALALPQCCNVTLDVIGDGPSQAQLQRDAKALGMSERIRWHGGIADEERIAKIANQCKAFVYPGSVGLSLIHAFAYGLPAILHNDRWMHGPEIAAHAHGSTGLSFDKSDVLSLAGAISQMIADKDQLTRFSSHTIELTNRTFNVRDMASRFVSVIDDLSKKNECRRS
jgi:Glycosyl transferases group 1